MELLQWFFETPTPPIAVASAIIAYLAYNHQRNLKKKDMALKLADAYSEKFIPRLRYIDSILVSIGADKFIKEFSDPVSFTEKELIELLKRNSGTIDKFTKIFDRCKREQLDKAYSQSGCNGYISTIHNNFLKIIDTNDRLLGNAVYKFILDFLNDIEAMASKFYYNIAEEELVYPILHQTFLAHMKNWYFFIAHKNSLDHDRFYPYTIWLYEKWHQREVKKRNSLNARLLKGYHKKKLH